MNFWDFFWLLVWTYAVVVYLMLLFRIIGDIIRDRGLRGWAKAVWLVALLVIPLLTSLIYVITRGAAMAERQAGAVQEAQAEADTYIRSVAGTSSPAEQIGSAKALLDDGTISRPEFENLKARALA